MSERERDLRDLLDRLQVKGAPIRMVKVVENELVEVLVRKVYASVSFKEE